MDFFQSIFANMKFMNLYLLLISTFVSAVLVFLIFALTSTKKTKLSQKPVSTKKPLTITSQDLKAIAGDNVITTQLDLARAYIEMGKTQLAKKILEHVLNHGDDVQRKDASKLISALEIS